jgi:hypothetical protein
MIWEVPKSQRQGSPLADLPDVALALVMTAFLWMINCHKYEIGTSPVPPSGIQFVSLAVLGWLSLKLARWVSRIRKR